MKLQARFYAVIRDGEESVYIADCPALHAVTQGRALDEIAVNLREVRALALEGGKLEELELAPSPIIVATLELEPAVA